MKKQEIYLSKMYGADKSAMQNTMMFSQLIIKVWKSK